MKRKMTPRKMAKRPYTSRPSVKFRFIMSLPDHPDPPCGYRQSPGRPTSGAGLLRCARRSPENAHRWLGQPHEFRVHTGRASGGSRPPRPYVSGHERSQAGHRSGHRARRGRRGRGAARARAGDRDRSFGGRTAGGRPRRHRAPRQARAVVARRLSHDRCAAATCSMSARRRTSASASSPMRGRPATTRRIERMIAATARARIRLDRAPRPRRCCSKPT